MKYVDDFLNSITMYRLVLYVLLFYLTVAVVLSFFNLLPFNPVNLIFSVAFLTSVCWLSNKVFSYILKAPTNLESVYITALILSLIITPARNFNEVILLSLVAVLSQASKYIFAINRKHLFNPAAFAVLASFIIFKFGASWWVGNPYMLIPVLIGGLLVVRKLQRFNLILSFFAIYLILIPSMFLESPILFFAFIMLIEPQTTPPTKKLQIIYGGLVGLGSFYFTPEAALLAGNIFAYIVSPKEKLLLKLKEKIQIAPDIYEFVFGLDKPMPYLAGQYMEWTLQHKNPDSRGSRRYFTIAASPTEENLRIGVKFDPKGSSFKKSLVSLNPGENIVASQLSGEFTLPKDSSKKLAFIAGGIGITPFRAMVQYLLDKKEKRDIIILYSNRTASDIVYKDIFDQSFQKLGIKTVYVNTDTMGFIDENMIRKQIGDFKERTFYISGPHSMIDTFENMLKKMGVKQIKIDFFPGYA